LTDFSGKRPKETPKEVSPFANGDKGAALDLPPFEKGGLKLY